MGGGATDASYAEQYGRVGTRAGRKNILCRGMETSLKIQGHVKQEG